MTTKAKSSKKGRKIGRNKNSAWGKLYTAAKKWVTNKLKKLKKHLKKHVNDKNSIIGKIVDYKKKKKGL